MKVLSLTSQKGGSGKTTLAGHLAVAAEAAGAGPVAVIDTDPQGSLTDWWNERAAPMPTFLNATVATLDTDLDRARDPGFALAIIDTPPAITDMIERVIALSDLVAIPTRPSPHDLRAAGTTIAMVENIGKPLLFVVNAANPLARITGEAAVVLSQHGTVAPVTVHQRTDFAASMIDGRTVMELPRAERSSDEITRLWSYLSGRLGGIAGQTVMSAGFAGLAALAGGDPEPEYVSINSANEAVVTLQENNHLAIVDLATGKVTRSFTAGTTDVAGIDIETDKVLSFDGMLEDLPREPDAVAWIDDNRFITANEGDYTGGSRGATIFDKRAWVTWDSGNAMEHIAARIGHYPEKRAGKKGTEPEGVAVGRYGDETMMLIGSERGNFLAVYRDHGPSSVPTFVQTLPTGVAPEGILPIPQRRLLVVAAEADSADDNVRSNIAIYVHGNWTPTYPEMVSVEADGVPLGWGALSGLAANPSDPQMLYAVPDSFYAQSRIFTVDVGSTPARIVAQRVLHKNRETVDYDLEGVAVAADGGFWLVSEGHPGREKLNLLIRATADGTVIREITLPDAMNEQAVRFGLEGVATTGSGADERVYVAFQREWNNNEKGQVFIGVYTPANGQWGFLRYPLNAPESPAGGWVGLSEITAVSDTEFMVIERDNKGGPDAAIKRIYAFSVAGLTPAPAGQAAPLVRKRLVRDLLTEMASRSGWTPDKLEGLTMASDGQIYAVTDNDGIDDATGETQFLRLGRRSAVLAQR